MAEEGVCSNCAKFYTSGDLVDILKTPSEFYQTVCALARSAEKRILLAALYLGTGSHETELVSLYHSPLLRGVLKWLLPQRWNEIIGLQHMKFFVFDDTVVLSGSNSTRSKSLSYNSCGYGFSRRNRQDRYIVVKDCSEFANYCEGLLDTVAKHSFVVRRSAGETKSHFEATIHPYEGPLAKFQSSFRRSIEKFCQAWIEKASRKVPREHEDTCITPFLQMGPFGVTEEKRFMKRLLQDMRGKSACRLDVASAYFNLTKELQGDLILGSDPAGANQINIIMASPEANGFHSGNGLSQYIPAFYVNVARDFYNRIVKCGQESNLKLFEYFRANWTFHGKGLWLYPSTEPGTLPNQTVIGSSNYGYRSEARDLEAQFRISTENEKLKNELSKERDRLFQSSYLVDQEVFERPTHYVPFWIWLLTPLFRTFF